MTKSRDNAAAYYNEIDPYCCAWLSNLMDAGLITPGVIDDRSIHDVGPDDVAGFERVHFFAGLGGWDFALKQAGWHGGVWTGSAPCQPFSLAGAQIGFDDPRHLWPQYRRLIAERLPAVVFGEQVTGKPEWLRLVRSDLEALAYAVGAIPLQAASADADHFRDRYWFVADLADGDGERSQIEIGESSNIGAKQSAVEGGGFRSLVDDPSVGWGEGWTEYEFRSRGFTAAVASVDGCQYLECPDGKWRRLPPPGVRWLGTRLPSRISKLRAIGNAIDHRPATRFIRAYMAARNLPHGATQ